MHYQKRTRDTLLNVCELTSTRLRTDQRRLRNDRWRNDSLAKRPVTATNVAFLRVASLRYAFLRVGFLHYASLRDAFLRVGFLRDASLRVAFQCDAFFCVIPI